MAPIRRNPPGIGVEQKGSGVRGKTEKMGSDGGDKGQERMGAKCRLWKRAKYVAGAMFS